jgi:hypothetical protein
VWTCFDGQTCFLITQSRSGAEHVCLVWQFNTPVIECNSILTFITVGMVRCDYFHTAFLKRSYTHVFGNIQLNSFISGIDDKVLIVQPTGVITCLHGSARQVSL